MNLFRIRGIQLQLHFTFFLLIAFIAQDGWAEARWAGLLWSVATVLAFFTCVVLHELGHSLTAMRFGIGVRRILLMPIGGMAEFDDIPRQPLREFLMTIAGPAVNFAIVGALWFVPLGADNDVVLRYSLAGLVEQVFVANLVMGCFNLLPAFPMDGGRVLRSLLAIPLGRRRATVIAANIGQVMAIFFGIIGFFINPFLIFIAIVVYLGAQAESSQVEMQSVLEGLRVRDGMMTRFQTLAAWDPLSKAVEELLAGSQHDFPVLNDGSLVGVLRRDDLVKALANGKHSANIADVMCRDCGTVDETDELSPALEEMSRNQRFTAPVMRGAEIVGLLTMENIGELVLVSPRAH